MSPAVTSWSARTIVESAVVVVVPEFPVYGKMFNEVVKEVFLLRVKSAPFVVASKLLPISASRRLAICGSVW